MALVRLLSPVLPLEAQGLCDIAKSLHVYACNITHDSSWHWQVVEFLLHRMCSLLSLLYQLLEGFVVSQSHVEGLCARFAVIHAGGAIRRCRIR